MQAEAVAGRDGSSGLGDPAGLARWAAGTLLASWLAAALLVGWRRVAGGLAVPLTGPVLAVCGLGAAVLAGLARVAWGRAEAPSRPGLLVPVLLSLTVLIWGASLSLPGTSPLGLGLFWGSLAIEETLAWGLGRRKGWMRPRRRPEAAGPDVSPEPVPVEPLGAPPPGEVTQQWTRSGTAGGDERIAGWLRVRFAAGQRNASVHVAFCPPFARAPRVGVTAREGPAARVRVVQALPYGARVDLKRGMPTDTPAEVVLQFVAETGPAGAPAAGPGQEADGPE